MSNQAKKKVISGTIVTNPRMRNLALAGAGTDDLGVVSAHFTTVAKHNGQVLALQVLAGKFVTATSRNIFLAEATVSVPLHHAERLEASLNLQAASGIIEAAFGAAMDPNSWRDWIRSSAAPGTVALAWVSDAVDVAANETLAACICATLKEERFNIDAFWLRTESLGLGGRATDAVRAWLIASPTTEIVPSFESTVNTIDANVQASPGEVALTVIDLAAHHEDPRAEKILVRATKH